MEYLQDKLKKEIKVLEQELKAYKNLEKDRTTVEIALFIVGMFAGIAIGFYGTMIF